MPNEKSDRYINLDTLFSLNKYVRKKKEVNKIEIFMFSCFKFKFKTIVNFSFIHVNF